MQSLAARLHLASPAMSPHSETSWATSLAEVSAVAASMSRNGALSSAAPKSAPRLHRPEIKFTRMLPQS